MHPSKFVTFLDCWEKILLVSGHWNEKIVVSAHLSIIFNTVLSMESLKILLLKEFNFSELFARLAWLRHCTQLFFTYLRIMLIWSDLLVKMLCMHRPNQLTILFLFFSVLSIGAN